MVSSDEFFRFWHGSFDVVFFVWLEPCRFLRLSPNGEPNVSISICVIFTDFFPSLCSQKTEDTVEPFLCNLFFTRLAIRIAATSCPLTAKCHSHMFDNCALRQTHNRIHSNVSIHVSSTAHIEIIQTKWINLRQSVA